MSLSPTTCRGAIPHARLALAACQSQHLSHHCCWIHTALFRAGKRKNVISLRFHQKIQLLLRTCATETNVTAYDIWYDTRVCVCLCVHCVFFLSAPEGCPSCQSYSVCAALWTEACSGRNLGRHSAPLKSFAQTRQSGTKARVQRNTRACAAVRVCLTELVRESKREERRTGTCGHRLRCFGVQVISIAYCNYCNLWSRVMAEIWVSWQTVALVVLCVHVCACLRTSFQVDAADGL